MSAEGETRPYSRLRVLSVSNQKGGVGKTTTTINLGTALAAVGERVMIIDLDPQGNASTGLGINRGLRKTTVYDVVVNEAPLAEAAVATALPGLDLVPSDANLSGVELELAQAPRRSFRLRDAIAGLRAQPDGAGYTYVLIDCPPSLNLLTVNAMAAADADGSLGLCRGCAGVGGARRGRQPADCRYVHSDVR